ncbi:MAG: fibronectin type III domain-containing protein [Lachnospiraceae bacterium]|nr:fibronectin type III domain-containing protein [Lachnospiraceae bacterium]
MKIFRKTVTYLLAFIMAFSLTAAIVDVSPIGVRAAEQTYTFTDRSGKEVTVPVSAFASSVISFTHGDPWMNDELHMDPAIALGIPDYVEVGSNSTGDLCMGAGGILILAFDRYITDGDGDDVYVFEVGGYVEETKVEVSADLKTWYELGYVRGNEAGLDLNGKVPEGTGFNYVRLTDTGANPNGDWPGADIDAVCGINTTTKKTTTLKAPGKTKISTAKASGTKLTVKCKKVSKNCKGYEFQISTDKNFTSPTTKTSSKNKVSFKNLKKNTTYYVRVRAYNKSGSTKSYGKWSAVKTVTIK